MTDVRIDNNLGVLLKKLLKERSFSMRKLSELTEIDKATVSRIINGKRKANPEHLQKFADCLGVPIVELFVAAGFPIEPKQTKEYSDIHTSVYSIQNVLESSNLYDNKFSIASVEQQLANYKQYVQTEEGKDYILKSFDEKLRKVGSIGPFINRLKDMYEKFCLKKGTHLELILIGSALIYFIVPVDVIPDYIFPFGFIDDAMAIQIVSRLLQ
ncbi:helix-turn-helix domain-containing protein [Bacillus sp. EB600]|uniref:helix-turn-helix domain-containing protein n=1 Tax=Bacillus sp. EB600 TaxID=2806345 RepID=UPI00210DF2B3|nr:helix-turn-helix domain-containing protein [Bacillus sp. EB600]MCQ6282215.1 helix-turn-helix domain-containing protein [Bacillus sp. EB600]